MCLMILQLLPRPQGGSCTSLAAGHPMIHHPDCKPHADVVKTHLEECTTRYLGFKCFLFSVYRVYPEVEDGRGTFDLACAFAVLFGVWKPGSVLLTAEVVW